MRYVEAIDGKAIPLGRQGENEVETVMFDVNGWEDAYGPGTFTLVHQRCRDGDGFEREVTVENGYVLWLITNVDVAYAGHGVAQLTYTVGNAVAKSIIMNTTVLKSLDASEEVPDPWKPWVDEVLEARNEAESAAENAAESEENAKTSEDNAKASEDNASASATIASESAESAAHSAAQASTFVGSPLVAATSSAMTDQTKIYVYVGSQAGYSNGHWYYYNGSAWADGGVYNSIADDVATNADIDAALYS